MHTTPVEKDLPRVPTFDAVPLSREEQEAMDWMDDLFATDLSARIGRMRWTDAAMGEASSPPVWTFKYEGDRNWFVGQPRETLRALILHAYRTSQTCAGCGSPLIGNNGEEHRCFAE
jgi:hypothetical protein